MFCLVLHISAYSIRCLLPQCPAIFRRFIIRSYAGDDILDVCGLLIALATFDVLCWIMSVMVSMSSSSCRVSNRFLNSSWNSIFFDPIRVASILGGLLVFSCFFSTSTSSLMVLITSLWALPMFTWLMTVTYVTMSVLFVRK